MTLPLSGPMRFSSINTELGLASTTTTSLTYLELGYYAPLNTYSPLKPDGNSPFRLSEWYGYDHNYSPWDSDALAFISAAGLTNAVQKDAINTLVLGLKSYGIWSKMYAIYPFIGGTAFTHKWNLKDPRDLDVAFRLSFFGGLTHSSTGILPNGSTGYADTFFTPSINISQATALSLGVYVRDNYIGPNGVDMGCATFGGGSYGSQTGIYAGYSTSAPQADFDCDLEDSTVYAHRRVGYTSLSDTRGFWIGSQDLTSANLYKNGSSFLTYRTNKINTYRSTTTNKMTIFAQRYQSATIRNYAKRELAFSFIGVKLSSSEVSNYNSLVESFQVALGRKI